MFIVLLLCLVDLVRHFDHLILGRESWLFCILFVLLSLVVCLFLLSVPLVASATVVVLHLAI